MATDGPRQAIDDLTRRRLMAASAAGGAVLLASAAFAGAASGAGTSQIRPFRVRFPNEAIVDLRRRIVATRWPDRETVADQSQGVQLAGMQQFVRYWGADYDWLRVEAQLNALPQFMTEIDGLDIHFIHVRSRHPGAMPLIMTHGYPGSIIELLGVIGPLTDPTAHGGNADDAFHLVIPSLPGYGFSAKPKEAGGAFPASPVPGPR